MAWGNLVVFAVNGAVHWVMFVVIACCWKTLEKLFLETWKVLEFKQLLPGKLWKKVVSHLLTLANSRTLSCISHWINVAHDAVFGVEWYAQGVVKQILPLVDGDGDDTVTGLDVFSSFLLVTTVFNTLYIYDLSRRSASTSRQRDFSRWCFLTELDISEQRCLM